MDNNLVSSHIGNLAQTGKDFNVIVTNAPFKLLSSLDKIYRTGSSNDGGMVLLQQQTMEWVLRLQTHS